MHKAQISSARSLNPVWAAGLVFILWLGYTAMQTYYMLGGIGEGQVAFLEFIPEILGVGVLVQAGFARKVGCSFLSRFVRKGILPGLLLLINRAQ